jgi:succinate dehydrogenase / fumarate reductase flavoprotein subunit
MANNEIKFDRYRFDVVVIGAGGAGLRAAVEARQAGLRVAIICKSLFGVALTDLYVRLVASGTITNYYFF